MTLTTIDSSAPASEETEAPRAERSQQTGLRCFVLVARHHRMDLSVERLQHDYDIGDVEPHAAQMVRMAREAKLHSKVRRISWSTLVTLEGAFPVMARLNNGNWVVFVGMDKDTGKLGVFDPLAENGKLLMLTEDEVAGSWSGETVFIKRTYQLTDPNQPFGLAWFMPEILRQRHLFRDVAITAIVLTLLGLGVPIFTQLVFDRVLTHNSESTLMMLAIGVFIVLVFEAIFTFLRQYFLLYATNKIDIRVAVRTFGQLMRLPIPFFERSSAGVLIKHMQQSSQIRNFLTGQLFSTIIDNAMLIIILPILVLYSWQLTLIVMIFTILICGVIVIMLQPFKKRLKALYEADAARQSLLVETIQGMRTVKALALEPHQRREWDERSAHTIKMMHEVARISMIGTSITGFMSKLMTVAIIVVGVELVITGDLTVGAMIAFNMLAARVSGPLLQIVGLVHSYQETALAVQMMGKIMNTPGERANDGGLRPQIRGRIEFDRVLFRYDPEGKPALDDVSFRVESGTIFGLVGRSGSGKTTVTRMMQGLYTPQQGLIKIDGIDLKEIDLVHLRTQIGVVLQDNFLFHGTVRDNIAAALPGASMAQVVEAAKLAGADEFIENLQRGYDTMLEENGANLSGGQKQRLAIARALITKPPILILDEATSALDPESEAIIQKNLKLIARGRTLVIVSHRLSSLVMSDAIMVMDRGRTEAVGKHVELLAKSKTYRLLWDQQTQHVKMG
jgi:ATP-binding cassette, subfamily B, bacterial HlyB/CyaB